MPMWTPPVQERLPIEDGDHDDDHNDDHDDDRSVRTSVQFGPSSVRTSKESTTPEVASEASFRFKLLGK